jgi:hypothetical protein
VRGLAPPPGSYRKVGLWAKPPKSDEKAEEEEAKEEEGKEGEEVRRREREREQFFFLSFDFFREAKITQKKTVQKLPKPAETRPRRPLQPRRHLLRRRRPPVPLCRPSLQAGALQLDERRRRKE